MPKTPDGCSPRPGRFWPRTRFGTISHNLILTLLHARVAYPEPGRDWVISDGGLWWAWPSSRMQEAGHHCILYTDLGNPTSNSVYRRIGYRAIAEGLRYRFA